MLFNSALCPQHPGRFHKLLLNRWTGDGWTGGWMGGGMDGRRSVGSWGGRKAAWTNAWPQVRLDEAERAVPAAREPSTPWQLRRLGPDAKSAPLGSQLPRLASTSLLSRLSEWELRAAGAQGTSSSSRTCHQPPSAPAPDSRNISPKARAKPMENRIYFAEIHSPELPRAETLAEPPSVAQKGPPNLGSMLFANSSSAQRIRR